MAGKLVWTPKMDNFLISGVNRGLSRAKVAAQLGVTKSAAISRYNRLFGVTYPSDKARTLTIKIRRHEGVYRREAKAARHTLLMYRMDMDGAPEDAVIRAARKAGATFKTIAVYFGYSTTTIFKRSHKSNGNPVQTSNPLAAPDAADHRGGGPQHV